MANTFFFYDLETSGLNPRQDRIMQFAGQRTDMELQPIGEPVNILVQLNDDTLPSPDAIMVTGISPQKTVEEGYTEAEFAQMAYEEFFTADTIAVGFNSIRFDDEFMRALFWRNFYDPYEWSWKDGRSRWDLLDVVRLTRALRPEGIEWPVTEDGKPTNRLELLTKLNGIDHLNAHDALADVEALIAVAQLIKQKQPQLYEYLLTMRDKKKVQELVNVQDKKPFVYASGRYDNEFNKTTVAAALAPSQNNTVIVYDLRYDPAPFIGLSASQLKELLYPTKQKRQQADFKKLPVKVLHYNRAPAVAPLGVLEQADGWQKIGLTAQTVQAHYKALMSAGHFTENVRSAVESRDEFPPQSDAEAQLYDGFLDGRDRVRVEAVRNASVQKLADFTPQFDDERLDDLLLRYKARSFPKSLNQDEKIAWEQWRAARLHRQLPDFMRSVERLMTQQATTPNDGRDFLLQELQLWAESVLPVSETSD